MVLREFEYSRKILDWHTHADSFETEVVRPARRRVVDRWKKCTRFGGNLVPSSSHSALNL